MERINRVADHVEHILKNTTNIVVDADRKLIGENNMKDNEKVYVVASPDMAKEISKTTLDDALIICTFMKPNTAVVVKSEDFEKMIDDGVWFERRSDGT